MFGDHLSKQRLLRGQRVTSITTRAVTTSTVRNIHPEPLIQSKRDLKTIAIGYKHGISCSVQHRCLRSVSPFQATVDVPAFAMAADAWSCVQKKFKITASNQRLLRGQLVTSITTKSCYCECCEKYFTTNSPSNEMCPEDKW
jgi:hypothetical protein